MADLVLRSWMGQLHSSLELEQGHELSPRLGSEELRIKLTPEQAALPLDQIKLLFRADIFALAAKLEAR